MFAKLLAELKRIAILLQSKKLVDKDYNPDDGGSETDDKFYLIELDDTMGLIFGSSFQKSDLTKSELTSINNDCLANELFTTKGIDVINKVIKNLPSNFITDAYRRNYYFPTIESIDYDLVSMPNDDSLADFSLLGVNGEGTRGISILVIINNAKYVRTYLSEGSYLTENTQFILRDI